MSRSRTSAEDNSRRRRLSAGRGCTVLSVGVSSSIVRGLRSIRATVSSRDIVFGNDIRFAISLPRRPTPERREGDTRFFRNMTVLCEVANSSLALHDRAVSPKTLMWLNLRLDFSFGSIWAHNPKPQTVQPRQGSGAKGG